MDTKPSTSHQDPLPASKRKKAAITVNEKRMIYNVYKYIYDEKLAEFNTAPKTKECVIKAAEMLGVGRSTVYKVLRERKENENFGKPKKPGPNRDYKDKIDEFTLNGIRQKVHEFFEANEVPTIKRIVNAVNEDPDLPNYSWSTMRKILEHVLKFKFQIKPRKSLPEKVCKEDRDTVKMEGNDESFSEWFESEEWKPRFVVGL